MCKKHKLKLFILAGEDSGDLHGSHIVQQIQNTYDNISLVGLGGKKLEQLGLRSFVPLRRLAVMGFGEVLKNIKKATYEIDMKRIIIKEGATVGLANGILKADGKKIYSAENLKVGLFK